MCGLYSVIFFQDGVNAQEHNVSRVSCVSNLSESVWQKKAMVDEQWTYADRITTSMLYTGATGTKERSRERANVSVWIYIIDDGAFGEPYTRLCRFSEERTATESTSKGYGRSSWTPVEV